MFLMQYDFPVWGFMFLSWYCSILIYYVNVMFCNHIIDRNGASVYAHNALQLISNKLCEELCVRIVKRIKLLQFYEIHSVPNENHVSPKHKPFMS